MRIELCGFMSLISFSTYHSICFHFQFDLFLPVGTCMHPHVEEVEGRIIVYLNKERHIFRSIDKNVYQYYYYSVISFVSPQQL